MKESSNPIWPVRVWNEIAYFVHDTDIVLPLLAASVFHYYKALASHDPWPIAMAMAFGIDLLHYRLVKHTVRQSGWGRAAWGLVTLITLAAVTGLQFIFYSLPDAAGQTLPIHKVIVFSSLIPLSVTLLACLQEIKTLEGDSLFEELYQQAKAKLAELEAKLKGNEAELKQANSKLKANETALKRSEAQLKENEAMLKANEEQLKRAEAALKANELRSGDNEHAIALAERRAERAEARLSQIEGAAEQNELLLRKDEAQRRQIEKLMAAIEAMRGELNEAQLDNERLLKLAHLEPVVEPVALDLIRMGIGQLNGDTQGDIAKRHSISTGKVSNVKRTVLIND